VTARAALKPASALVYDPGGAEAGVIRKALRAEFELFHAADPDDARAILADQDVALAFVVAEGDGMPARDLLAEMARRWPETVRIALAPADDRAVFACEAAGAQDILALPLIETAARVAARHARALFRLRRAHDRQRLELRLREPGPARRPTIVERNAAFERIVRAPGSPMTAVCEQAARIATFDVPALILGETGCGKELLARAIHGVSLRSDRPFHAVNCGAIPDELLESELFGHRKGAFTGAHAHRTGLLEQADKGTIFLDEVADTSPAFQVKLLRFLQEGEIRPVGANETAKVDVRVIAACNRDLEGEVAAGRFRADLYYRLAVAPITVPPLRDRRADLPLLVERLLDRAMASHGKRVEGVTRETLAFLAQWSWPGNIRELENEILRMLMLAPGDRIGPELVAPRILRAAPRDARPDDSAEAAVAGSGCLRDRVERMEARILRETLIRHGWNKSRAAEELGLSRVGLRAKLDRYGLDREDGRLSAAAE
jgi:two-component system response regulator HupR/HoxA